MRLVDHWLIESGGILVFAEQEGQRLFTACLVFHAKSQVRERLKRAALTGDALAEAALDAIERSALPPQSPYPLQEVGGLPVAWLVSHIATVTEYFSHRHGNLRMSAKNTVHFFENQEAGEAGCTVFGAASGNLENVRLMFFFSKSAEREVFTRLPTLSDAERRDCLEKLELGTLSETSDRDTVELTGPVIGLLNFLYVTMRGYHEGTVVFQHLNVDE